MYILMKQSETMHYYLKPMKLRLMQVCKCRQPSETTRYYLKPMKLLVTVANLHVHIKETTWNRALLLETYETKTYAGV